MATIAEALTQARHFHQLGALGQAEQLYRKILQADPTNGEALNLLGMIFLHSRRVVDALGCLRQALRFRPQDPDISYNLGVVCQVLNKQDEAASHLREALRLRPNFAAAHNDLGNVLTRHGKWAEAVDHFRKAIGLQPDFGGFYLNLADALQNLGNLEEAAECLRQCLARLPQFPEAHYNLGNVHQIMGKHAQAVEHFQDALRLRPDFHWACINLGNSLVALGKSNEAAEQFEQALRLQPDCAEAHFLLGNVRREQRQVAESIRLFQRALELKSNYPEAHNMLGEAFLEQGETEKARSYFRQALPNHTPFVIRTLLNMAAHGFYTDAEPSIDQLKGWLSHPGLLPDFVSQVHFTLGYLLERKGAWDQAFEHFRQGNAVRRALLHQWGMGFDAAEHARRIDRLIDAFSPDYFRMVRGWGLDTELPVFIVGMPRSGTTLVEQILANHPKVFGAGELHDLGQLAAGLPGRLDDGAGYPECVTLLQVPMVQELAIAHLERLTLLGGGAERVIDKMPENFLHLGIIATLFPQAKVIHCRRDPQDVCLSCFFMFFSGLNFSWDLDDLGRYYRDYERLMAHWKAVLPVPVLEVVYEDLVANQEQVSRRLVDFCGLEWDERCLKFYESRRTVQTASKLQVRQPIYTKSVGRWRHYAAHLGPLRQALGLPEPGQSVATP